MWRIRRKKEEEKDIKNIDKNLEINLSNPIAQTKSLLLKIDEKVTSNEEFADESKSDNEDSYYEVDISKVEKKWDGYQYQQRLFTGF